MHSPNRTRILLTAVVAPLLWGCKASDVTDPGDAFVEGVTIPGVTSELFLQSGQRSRSYLLHDVQAPSGTTSALPLVIMLHGSGLTAADMRATSSMDSLADARHFIVAYAQGMGSPSDWNAGNCCGDASAMGTDDIAFLKAIISDVSVRIKLDRRRIYVAGFSDGARMAYRVACEMSSQIAAIAAVSGSLVTSPCAPPRVMPVIAFNGTADPSVLYGEATAVPLPPGVPVSAASFPPVVRFWMASAGCKNTSSFLFARTTVRYLGTGCASDVAFYSTVAGVHAWPTSADYGFSASVVIVDFFKAHVLP